MRPVPLQDVAGVRPVPVQMRQGRAHSRCRCGRGEAIPGADEQRGLLVARTARRPADGPAPGYSEYSHRAGHFRPPPSAADGPALPGCAIVTHADRRVPTSTAREAPPRRASALCGAELEGYGCCGALHATSSTTAGLPMSLRTCAKRSQSGPRRRGGTGVHAVDGMHMRRKRCGGGRGGGGDFRAERCGPLWLGALRPIVLLR